MNMELEVNIDFNEASREWRLNKKRHENCFFNYKCLYFSNTKNTYCPNKVVNYGYCAYHWRREGQHSNIDRKLYLQQATSNYVIPIKSDI